MMPRITWPRLRPHMWEPKIVKAEKRLDEQCVLLDCQGSLCLLVFMKTTVSKIIDRDVALSVHCGEEVARRFVSTNLFSLFSAKNCPQPKCQEPLLDTTLLIVPWSSWDSTRCFTFRPGHGVWLFINAWNACGIIVVGFLCWQDQHCLEGRHLKSSIELIVKRLVSMEIDEHIDTQTCHLFFGSDSQHLRISNTAGDRITIPKAMPPTAKLYSKQLRR